MVKEMHMIYLLGPSFGEKKTVERLNFAVMS